MSVAPRSDMGPQGVVCLVSPTEAAELVVRSLEFGALRDQSSRRLGDLFLHFGSYAERGCGCEALARVTPDQVRGFVNAPLQSQQISLPSIATKHLRRSAVRLLFQLSRRIGLVDTDPTLDVDLPPRSSLRQRALTHDEVLVCRSFSIQALTETRQSAAWALAEATARTGEIPHIRISHLELGAGRVFIPGTHRTEPRWGYLTEWGLVHMERRLRSMKDLSNDPPVVYAGQAGGESGQASSCAAIAAILVRAGLGGEPDVGPGSVAAWSGADAHARGLPIDEVARILGVRSLDRAARIIGWDWRGEGG